ncbi:histidine kinase, partial [Salinarimonas sp. NSM]
AAAGGGRARIAIIAGAVAAVIGAIAATALSLGDDPPALVAEAPAPGATPPVEDGKIVERIGEEVPAAVAAPQQPDAPPLASDQDGTIAVAQRAVLYEEDPLNPQGEPRAAAGRAVWTVEPGGQGEPVVRATVEIPDPRLRLVMLIRRNLDPTLPASHTIDLSFETGDMESRRVRDIGLLQLKDEETIRGAPVAGLPVPVRDNLFLIGLSNLPRDIERNTVLMTERNWIDLPVRLASGQRAILSFEKGTSGDRIIDEAFAQWGESTVSAGAN